MRKAVKMAYVCLTLLLLGNSGRCEWKRSNAADDEALRSALLRTDRRATEILLIRGGDPNRQDVEGDSAVSIASELQDAWFLNEVLKHKGNPNLVNRRTG